MMCLVALKTNLRVQGIVHKATTYLLAQRSPTWSWNYWDRSSSPSTRFPDDLDTTTTALTAITIHTPEHLTDDVLLTFVNNLISNEVYEGGPYFTWMTPSRLRDAWDDVDGIVNSNIHFFLKQHEIFLERLDDFLKHTLSDQSLTSRYTRRIHRCFFLSKNCTGRAKKELLQLLVRSYPNITNPLDRALFITTYLTLDGNPQKISHEVTRLLKTNLRDLDPHSLFVEDLREGSPLSTPSRGLTVAAMIQAITLYENKKT